MIGDVDIVYQMQCVYSSIYLSFNKYCYAIIFIQSYLAPISFKGKNLIPLQYLLYTNN